MLTRASVEAIELHVRRRDDGRWQLRARVSLGPGQQHGPRLAPTYSPAQPGLPAPPPDASLRFDSVLAEDGGRLLALCHRYRVWELAPDQPEPAALPGEVWLELDELPELVQRGLVDIELRSCVLALLLTQTPGS